MNCVDRDFNTVEGIKKRFVYENFQSFLLGLSQVFGLKTIVLVL